MERNCRHRASSPLIFRPFSQLFLIKDLESGSQLSSGIPSFTKNENRRYKCVVLGRKGPYFVKTKMRRSDSVLWQKLLHQQQCQKGKVTTQTTPQNISIKQRLRTDLGRFSLSYSHPTGVVYRFYRAHLLTHRNSCVIEDKNLRI